MSPRVLCIVDFPGWAHDIKTGNLQRTLRDAFMIEKRYQSDVTEADLDGADLVLVYFWYQFEVLPHLEPAFARNRGKILAGVCSHGEVEGERAAAGIATIRRWAQGVFAINRRLVDTCQRHLDLPVFYTPNGVDTTFYRPDSARRRGRALRVGWAGSLDNHGPDIRGIELIRSVVTSLPGMELTIAAREERWRGPDEMLAFYQSLDVYVCASRDEGGPNPCLEAAACGVPLVTTAVGCLPELVRDGVNSLLIRRDAEDLAAKLRRLRDDEGLRLTMGREIRRDVEAWDWRLLARAYADMFDSILHPPAPDPPPAPAARPRPVAERDPERRNRLAGRLRAERRRAAALKGELEATRDEMSDVIAELQGELVRASRPPWRRRLTKSHV